MSRALVTFCDFHDETMEATVGSLLCSFETRGPLCETDTIDHGDSFIRILRGTSNQDKGYRCALYIQSESVSVYSVVSVHLPIY
jgi:hypothetical protein